MKLLIVTEASSAGVGRHVLDLAQGLLEREVDVHLVWSPLRSEPAFEERMAALPDLVTHRVPMRRSPSPSDRIARRKILQVISEHGPFDVIHGQSTKAGILVRRLGRAARGSAVVYTPHCLYTMNPDAPGPARFVAATLERLLAGRADALIAVSPSEERHAKAQGLQPKRLVCIPNGVMDLPFLTRAEARKRLELPAEAHIVGSIGRLSPQKDPLLLIEAFELLRARLPEARLAVAGTGPLLEAARADARRRGLHLGIDWLGHQPPEVLLPAVDVLCMSSRYEAMPYVMLEALAAGLPIVTTRVGGAEVTVEPGRNGHIVEAGDALGLAEALMKWLSAPRDRAQARARSLELAETLSVDRMVDETLALYRELSAGVQARLALAP